MPYCHHYSTTDRRYIKLKDGRVVGAVEVQTATLIKYVVGSRHKLLQPPAWALDVDVLKQAEALGAKMVEIRDTESGCSYRATIEQIKHKGFYFDRKWGLQIALKIDYWELIEHDTTISPQLRFSVMGDPND